MKIQTRDYHFMRRNFLPIELLRTDLRYVEQVD